MSDAHQHDDTPPICHRCGALLTRGDGSFYIVRIEAFADPSPPEITSDDLLKSPEQTIAEYEAILAQMRDLSEQEMMDQVYRKMTLMLCRACYDGWIEQPVG